jgi:hypothetical protein
MQVNIQSFIKEAGLEEPFYPGKRVIKACPQPGEYKSHCVVYDWHDPSHIRIEIKAGLSGKDLPAKELTRYPISFQAPTFIEINVKTGAIKTISAHARDEDDEDDDESRGGKGKSGGGGKSPIKKKDGTALSLNSFIAAAEGKVAELGQVVQMVVMGMEIAKEAYANVMDTFFVQVNHAKIQATELVAAAGKLITKFTPPAFLKPDGSETKVYKYNREKNEPMFTGMTP